MGGRGVDTGARRTGGGRLGGRRGEEGARVVSGLLVETPSRGRTLSAMAVLTNPSVPGLLHNP